MTAVVYGVCPGCGRVAHGGALTFEDTHTRVVACGCGSLAPPVQPLPVVGRRVEVVIDPHRRYVDAERYAALEQLEKAVRDVEAIVADCPGIASALAAVNAAPPLRSAA